MIEDDDYDPIVEAEFAAWVRFLEPLLLTPPQFLALCRVDLAANARARELVRRSVARFL